MAREEVKHDILRLVGQHDGQLYWYQVDRSLSGTRPGCVGPFSREIADLAGEGLIKIRPNPDLGPRDRYWITEAGRRKVSDGAIGGL
jgi:hypothetical protein